MKVLFVNPTARRCGVHQYGVRFFEILSESVKVKADYTTIGILSGSEHLVTNEYDVVILNYHPGIAEWGQLEGIEGRYKKVGIYHELSVAGPRCDMWLFSDPSGSNGGSTVCIGRPLPRWLPKARIYDPSSPLVVGLNGFCGAWATAMIAEMVKWETNFKIRLALPPSDHCDPSGARARQVAESCLKMMPDPKNLEVTHQFMEEDDLLEWLSQNDLNCYIRTPEPSVGISSALDLALAVRRPIAINKHAMFRHLWGCDPGIFLETSGLRRIISNGLGPLVPIYQRNRREVVLGEIEQALESLS